MLGDVTRTRTALTEQMKRIVIKENATHGCLIAEMVVVFTKHGNAVRKFVTLPDIDFNSLFCTADGDYDCTNKADEENCNVTTSTNIPNLPDSLIPTCHDWMFKCQNLRCVPYWWKCDGMNGRKSFSNKNYNFI